MTERPPTRWDNKARTVAATWFEHYGIEASEEQFKAAVDTIVDLMMAANTYGFNAGLAATNKRSQS